MSAVDELVRQFDTVLGFRFEPERRHSNNDDSNNDTFAGKSKNTDNDEERIAEIFEERAKTTSSEWCTCAKCVDMNREIDCICCRELGHVQQMEITK